MSPLAFSSPAGTGTTAAGPSPYALIGKYSSASVDSDYAKSLRRDFVRSLVGYAASDPAECRDVARFLAEQVEAADVAGLKIEGMSQAVRLCELLLSFRYESPALQERTHGLAAALLKSTLLHYERSGDLGKLFKLAQIVPNLHPKDPELVRLRSRAHLYEMRRAGKLRSWLYAYMIVQAALVTVIFPFLFVNAENGNIQDQIEATTSIDLEAGAPLQTLSFSDGLYWSVITAASIGYGDITPGTRVGRLIAALLGTMGVVTVGVMAGLILFWISPRSLHW